MAVVRPLRGCCPRSTDARAGVKCDSQPVAAMCTGRQNILNPEKKGDTVPTGKETECCIEGKRADMLHTCVCDIF